jgi:hypothetical protein
MLALLMFSGTSFSSAKTRMDVSGVITQNTFWANANSPYDLEGDIQIASGAVLTVEAGTIINLNTHVIEVDGTLQALGNITDDIIFNNGQITFSKSSASWDEIHESGSIIDNSLLSSVEIEINSNAKIVNSCFANSTTSEAVIHIPVGSPVLKNNTIVAPQAYVLIWCGGSAIISNNTISGGEFTVKLDGAFGYGLNTGAVTVANNTIDSTLWITNHSSGKINVVNNLLGRITVGEETSPDIENNTVLNGIYLQSNKAAILYNNILHQDGQYAIYNNNGAGVNASYNWWGTTDTAAIEGSIYQAQPSYVTFVPFLNSPNSQAPPIPANAITETPSPTVPEISLPIAVFILTTSILGVLACKKLTGCKKGPYI